MIFTSFQFFSKSLSEFDIFLLVKMRWFRRKYIVIGGNGRFWPKWGNYWPQPLGHCIAHEQKLCIGIYKEISSVYFAVGIYLNKMQGAFTICPSKSVTRSTTHWKLPKKVFFFLGGGGRGPPPFFGCGASGP